MQQSMISTKSNSLPVLTSDPTWRTVIKVIIPLCKL